ncbi:MAG: FHA domain-containing protein [Lutisporaceae bacterium]
MNARMRRLISDWEQVKKDFDGHKNILVEPVGSEPPERYNITYFVNGIYLMPDGRINTLGQHRVEITLHSEYPRYKPICKISTPIWHPNFKDGQICIGDIWGAGESLSDIIVNIGDMIQYRSWNSLSPLSAEAAKWAILNKYLFPVGKIDLWRGEIQEASSDFEIDLFDGNEEMAAVQEIIEAENDFEITIDDLKCVEFIPTAQRIQSDQHKVSGSRGKINFKTIFMKGILFGLLGGLIAWIMNEALNVEADTILGWMGYDFDTLINNNNMTENQISFIIMNAIRLNTAIFSGIIGGLIGAAMGLGEGIYYGSKEKAIKYTFTGLGIALAIGVVGGYIAQILYSNLLVGTDEYTPLVYLSFVRAIGWAIMGLGVGIAVGLIKPEKMRVINCSIGGLVGGFIGGFAFDFISRATLMSENDTGTIPRAVGIIVLGALIGLGIGLLEQFAKAAWLKVIRGEFEGKEYLVFAGITSIGNSGKNTIVLFKDKLVAPYHCDIILEANRYVLVDKGTPMGTIVNGMRVNRHILKQGDAIALGNSVLIFNTK